MNVQGNLEPHQLGAINKLRDALVELDRYDEVPSDDSLVLVEENSVYTELTDEVGAMLTLGHLRDIVSIFFKGE